jgi:hypothetical protein
LLDALRSGNWSCSSYFRISVPPTLKPFSAWSFLTTLPSILVPLLPSHGLSHADAVACLSNLWWVLSTPLQCGSTAQMFRELPALVDSTPLLRSLGLLINLPSQSTRGPFGSLADYWADCSAEDKNYLAYRALTDADKLLDIFCIFIRPHRGTYPSMRRAISSDRPPEEWTLVNPALSDSPTVNWLSHHEQDSISPACSTWDSGLLLVGAHPHSRSGGGPTPTISWEQTCRKTGSIVQEGERGQSPRSPGIVGSDLIGSEACLSIRNGRV